MGNIFSVRKEDTPLNKRSGEIPWADLTNKEAAQAVMEGLTLPKPEGCSDVHHKLMLGSKILLVIHF